MKKSLIALAVLAASGIASAQSSVTLFGVVDARVAVGKGSIANRTQLATGGLTTSRFGLRGTEDLGGGLAASFWLEGDVANDSGAGGATNVNNQTTGGAPAGQNGGQGLTFNRRSTVSLSGGWGELRLGRDYTPQFWALVQYDPFGIVGVGNSVSFSNIITGPTAVRASNSIGYLLPSNLGGFYGQVQYYLGENASNVANSDDGTGVGFRLGYAAGPLNVSLASGSTDYAAGKVRQTNVGASWDFGVAKMVGQVSSDKNGAVKANGWLVGGLIPMGAGEVRLAYSQYKIDQVVGADPRSRKLSLGYVHNLSKRTALYTTYARVRNDGGATTALNGSTTAANASSSGYEFGLRHSF